MNQSKLYVGNLAYNVSQEEIKQFFSEYGEITDVRLITDKETGRSKGFAFVSFGTSEAAQAALRKDGEEWNGRRLKINIAKDREDTRPAGGGHYKSKRF